jgi:hypothetical protein
LESYILIKSKCKKKKEAGKKFSRSERYMTNNRKSSRSNGFDRRSDQDVCIPAAARQGGYMNSSSSTPQNCMGLNSGRLAAAVDEVIGIT